MGNLRDRKVDLLSTDTLDFHGRQIKNAADAVDPLDYVTLQQLTSAIRDLSNQINSIDVSGSGSSNTSGWYTVPISGGAALPVPSKGYTQNVVATGNVALTNPSDKTQTSWILRFVQDATGGRTLTFGTNYIGVTNLALITDPNTRSMLHFTTRPDGKCEINFVSTGLAIS